jgi:hypothetical protein
LHGITFGGHPVSSASRFGNIDSSSARLSSTCVQTSALRARPSGCAIPIVGDAR